MRKILNMAFIGTALFLSSCAHSELKSPCNNARLAAAPGINVPCDTSKPINRLAMKLEIAIKGS